MLISANKKKFGIFYSVNNAQQSSTYQNTKKSFIFEVETNEIKILSENRTN